MTRPVLGVDRVVLHGGIEPQAVALLAVIERPFQRAGLRLAAPAPAAAAATARRLVAVLVGGRLLLGLGLLGRFLGLRLGACPGGLRCIELLRDQLVVLGTEVDLVIEVDAVGVVGDEIVLALEGGDLLRRDL